MQSSGLVVQVQRGPLLPIADTPGADIPVQVVGASCAYPGARLCAPAATTAPFDTVLCVLHACSDPPNAPCKQAAGRLLAMVRGHCARRAGTLWIHQLP